MAKTINDIYLELLARFKEADSPQPALEAKELTAYACHADKTKFAEWGHGFVDDATDTLAHSLCTRCLEGEPLAYILGEWDFYGITLEINSSVLIPRPDTERVAELAIERANDLFNPRVLDLCCGSGCIGLAIASKVDDARVTAIDLSDDAISLSQKNAEKLSLQNRYAATKANVLHAPSQTFGHFDIIVSNPPYVTAEEMKTLDHSVAGFEPYEALYGGDDGLDFYRAICDKWASLLVPSGLLIFECGYRQAREVAAILDEHHFAGIGIRDDLSGIPRIVFGYSIGE